MRLYSYALFLLWGVSGFAQEHRDRLSLPVSTTNALRVHVNFIDKVWPELESAMNRDLRKLGDVVLTDSGWDVEVSVIVDSVTMQSETIGYAVSDIATKSADPIAVTNLVGDRFQVLLTSRGIAADRLFAGYRDALHVLDHSVWYADAAAADKLAGEIVGRLNINAFEPERKLHQEYFEAFEKVLREYGEGPSGATQDGDRLPAGGTKVAPNKP